MSFTALDLAKELFSDESSTLRFYVNNDLNDLKKVFIDPKKTVLEYLRENGLTGTKYGCGEGGCGACTVVIAEFDDETKLIKYRSANACLLPLCAIHCKQIITIEGIGNCEIPHCIQDRLAKGHGSQCGFCTPGIVMAFYGFLKLNPNPSIKDIEESMDGNLCRCTGYRPILDSFRTFSKELSPRDSNNNNECTRESNNSLKPNKSCRLADFTELKPYDPNLDIPFPTDLINLKPSPLALKSDNYIWLQPVSVQELLKSKKKFPNAVLLGGNTEIGIDTKIKLVDYRVFINVSKVSELQSFSIVTVNGREMLEIGANITLNELIKNLKEFKNICKKYQISLLNALLSNLKWFASNQIRNFATLAGNIVTASPISDLNPILMTAEAFLTVGSENNKREIEIRKFFLGYRKVDLNGDEVLLKVNIPLPETKLEIIHSYKQAKRRDDDIAIVNGAFKVKLDENYVISQLDLSYGGLAPTTIFLNEVKEKSKGLKWGDEENLNSIYDTILQKINLPYSVPGGMPTYRRTLSVSFFTKFWHQIIRELNIQTVPKSDLKIDVDEIERKVSTSVHEFGESTDGTDPSIGTTEPNVMGLKQTTGVAKYVDDIPKQAGELFAGAVLSSKPHALLLRVDPSKALSLEGVHAYIDHKDLKHNSYGIITKDDEFFASKEVNFVGQLIGLIIADSKTLARKAASLVQIDYEPLPFVLTIEDAVEHNSFFSFDKAITKGLFNSDTFKIDENDDNEVVLEGKLRVGGQEHFYLETHGCLAIPKNEDNEMEIFSSTQSPTEVQKEVAEALGIPSNRVVCKVKRIGGGFGGKETRATFVAVAAAVAAKKLKRPVRFILDRDIDMLITGTRHPFIANYKLRITKDGLFKAYDIDLISNAGYSFDLSRAVMEGALLTVDNVYNFPKLHVRGRLAKTNIASNTAFRGFGAPQGMMFTEMMITEVAEKLKLDQLKIREKNMYKSNEITHFNMPVEDWFIPDMWSELLEWSKYKQQREEIELFNSQNLYKKRGLAMIPSKFGIAFKQTFFNQAGALVHVYTDGSVLISHGGVEMGQGLHSKMIQIAANTLQISPNSIFISETSTDKVANTPPTAASVSSDTNGMAVYNACKEIYDRLEPFRTEYPDGNLAKWAQCAHFNRVNLSANGFYKTPDLTYDWATNTGRIVSYFTTGVSVSTVELDVLTGDSVILRSDIIMDIGKSLNYAIDIGQIEGGFIQGVGWCTIEELLVIPSNGSLFTRGPGNYKIPSFHTIPVEFNVKILRDKVYKNLKTIKSSKGIGEPPLFLGASVFFALRDAVNYARKSNSILEPLEGFESPCTSEVLRLACADSIVKKATVLPKETIDKSGKKHREIQWSVRP